MKTITSRSNPLYKQLHAQMKDAGRPGHDIWLEGMHLCQAWLMHKGQPQFALLALEARGLAEIESLINEIDPDKQIWLPQKLIGSLSTLVTAPSVIFLGDHRQTRYRQTAADRTGLTGSHLLIDDIQDPGNVGTLLRTAAAAGIRSVFSGPATAGCWSPKVLRAGQGAQFALDIYESVNLRQLITDWSYQTKRPQILATALDATATSLFDLKLDREVAWIFGHEGRGVDPALLALADHKVFIAHDTDAVESLNVASAGAVCLFEQRRQWFASNQS